MADPSLSLEIQGYFNNQLHDSQQSSSIAPMLIDEWVDDVANEEYASSQNTRADVFHGSTNQETTSFAISGGTPVGTNSGPVASWVSRTTVTGPGLNGMPGILRVTMHLDATLEVLTEGTEPSASTSYSVSSSVADTSDYVTTGSAYYDGGNSTYGGETGTPAGQLGTFTYDADFTFGHELILQGNLGINSGVGIGYYGGSALAHAVGRLSFGHFEVVDANYQPVNFSIQSELGSARGDVLAQGVSYSGISLTNNALGRFNSAFQFLDGTASHDTNVIVTFVAPLEIQAASDVVDLSGTDGDLQVVQIDWNPGQAFSLGPLQYMAVLFAGREGGTRWYSATFGNYNGPPPTFVGDRPYNPATDFHLGYEGVDTTNHKVWAVINHNSLFAAGIPFELVSVVSRKTHGSAGAFDINMPLTGPRGIECRNSGGNHTLVFTFKTYLADVGQVSVTAGSGTISGTPTISANTMTVNLTGVANGQVTTISLHNTKDVANQILDDTSVNIGFLVGDTSGNGLVTSTDVSQIKLQSGHAVTSANFREDLNANGTITGTDVSAAKLSVGSGVP